MRMTLTLDDDVAAILKRLRKSHDASLKDLANEALRRVAATKTTGVSIVNALALCIRISSLAGKL